MSLFPAIYLSSDVTSGHGSWPPVGYAPPPAGASANVMMNGAFVHKVGDVTLPHYAFLPVPPDLHSDVIVTGEPSVLINGSPVAIQGLSFLAPSGIVAGMSTLDVIVRIGNLNNPTALSGVFAA